MYVPTNLDTQLLVERANQLAGQIVRTRQGLMTEDEFKPLRLQNGLYIQRHAPMLRIAIAYGMLRSDQLRRLARVSRTYDKGYGHLTTRQNMQLNWIAVDDVPAALTELAEIGLHGIQSSGNCLRNITSDALAGIAPDEILDPRPYAELLRQWSTFHPELSFLPRKFKVALTGTPQDRALVQVHDLAFEVVRIAPDVSFRVRVGGGLGRTPILGPVLKDQLDWQDLLSYTHAVMRVYNELGRRDNLTKARIKILVRTVGVEAFAQMVEQEFLKLRNGPDRLSRDNLAQVKSRFVDPDWTKACIETERLAPSDPDHQARFERWLSRNRLPHRVAGMAGVLIPVKGAGRAPGDLTAQDMEVVADIADRFSQGFIRVTHTQNLLLPAVAQADLARLYDALVSHRLAHPVGGLISDMVACPGGDYCSLANARSLPLAEDIAQRFGDLDDQENLGPIDLRISGCMNSCGHHHIGHIGVLGVDKDGAAFYQILLGGHSGHGAPAALGKIIGRAFAEDEVADALELILDHYLRVRAPGETFHDAVGRLGSAAFAQAAESARRTQVRNQ